MMCDGCKQLADAGALAKHTRKRKPHCEYPLTCTCQHKPIKDGYVRHDRRLGNDAPRNQAGAGHGG